MGRTMWLWGRLRVVANWTGFNLKRYACLSRPIWFCSSMRTQTLLAPPRDLGGRAPSCVWASCITFWDATVPVLLCFVAATLLHWTLYVRHLTTVLAAFYSLPLRRVACFLLPPFVSFPFRHICCLSSCFLHFFAFSRRNILLDVLHSSYCTKFLAKQRGREGRSYCYIDMFEPMHFKKAHSTWHIRLLANRHQQTYVNLILPIVAYQPRRVGLYPAQTLSFWVSSCSWPRQVNSVSIPASARNVKQVVFNN